MAQPLVQAQTVTAGDRVHLLAQVRLTPEPGYREGGGGVIQWPCELHFQTLPLQPAALELDLKRALPPRKTGKLPAWMQLSKVARTSLSSLPNFFLYVSPLFPSGLCSDVFLSESLP